MDESKLQSRQHFKVRNLLRVVGPLTVVVGLTLIIVGFGSFFAAFGSFHPPRFIWCAFAGMPLLFVGTVMCRFGYLGALQRYVAGESAPVVKDVVNYMGEGVQPAVKAVAKAITEGIVEGQKEQQQKP